MFNLVADTRKPFRPSPGSSGAGRGRRRGLPDHRLGPLRPGDRGDARRTGFLKWESRAWILDSENGAQVRPAAVESGFWRPLESGEVELLLAHPSGILELYYGMMEPARIQLKTDGVLRAPRAKEYNAATRMYGLVDSQLMWVMDMAAVGPGAADPRVRPRSSESSDVRGDGEAHGMTALRTVDSL